MIDEPARAGAAGEGQRGGPLRQLLVANGWALVGGAAGTVAVQFGVLLAAIASREGNPAHLFGGGQLTDNEVLAALAVCVLWAALAAPVLAASGRTAWSAVVRGGIVADASIPVLLVLWALCPNMALLAAAKTYCILVGMVLVGIAATRLARSPAGRFAWAVLASVAMLGVLAGPFWVGGAIHDQPRPVAQAITEAAVEANGFYAVTASVGDAMRFTWHQAGFMYRITRIGDYTAAPPLSWYPAVLIHLAAAVVLGALAALLGRLRGRDPAR